MGTLMNGAVAAGRTLLSPLGFVVLLVACDSEGPSSDPGPWGDGGLPPVEGGSSFYDTGTWPSSEGGTHYPIDNEGGVALPADVCGVLNRNACLECHSQPMAAGAPMPLTLAAHFKASDRDGNPLAPTVLARVQDEAAPMPPASTGKPLPSAGDVAVLKSWIEGGMQGVAGGECTPASVETDAGIGDGKKWSERGWPEGQCEKVLTLGAHEVVGKPLEQDDKPYPVPNKETTYHCFYEQVPGVAGDKWQAIAMRARIETPDDKAVVHHLVISGQQFGNVSVGGVSGSGPGDHKDCLNPNGATMAVWAPGLGNPATFPEDVGLQMPPPGSLIEMQVHYNNQGAGSILGSTPKFSKVRYDICLTKKLKPNEAGVFWLGYENAFLDTLTGGAETTSRLDNKGNGTAVGRCSAKTKARILSIMPHMHEQGVHGKFEIVSKNGTATTIVDKPFNFEDQAAYYQEDLWIEQGDYVRTTCKWKKSPVYFGFGSSDEMCFFYTLAYPISAFQALPLLGERGFVGGDMACAAMAGP